MPAKHVTLDDKFDLSQDRIFISGSQAVIRMALTQKERDRKAGHNTACFISGYRGSPLGGLDQQFWRSRELMKDNDIVFQPGLNEDLAATALWGSQQAQLRGDGRYDGVFGIWYGKGPGVDRSGDVFRHGNLAGTSPHGGVLALMGDDHTAESSTTAHQSEFAFIDAMIPIFNPAGVQDMIDYGIAGWELGRYAGTWAGLKCVKDNIESTATVDVSADRQTFILPDDFMMPDNEPHIRQFDPMLAQEERLHNLKLPAVKAFLRANQFDRMVMNGGKAPKIGVIATGKSWLDVLQALDELGIDEVAAAKFGLRVYKVAVPWPLEADGVRRFAAGLEKVIVVEEKRAIIEPQLKELLYGTANAPQIIGKKNEKGETLFVSTGALDSNDVAVAIGSRLGETAPNEQLANRVEHLRGLQDALRSSSDVAQRNAYFCAGCPHSTSTRVPEGSRAYAGIGCHYMSQFMNRSTEGYTQMGGEGANWIGEAPFSTRGHVFQNLGDGTYNHSGYLAIRAAIASGVTMTYKILYNDAVAMTGGQPHEGDLTPDQIARQVAAAGVSRIALVSDEPDKYPAGTQWPSGITFDHRDDLDQVQRSLREESGVSVLIYDQTCASEKRRRRKRGKFPDPDKRVVINELVCEGCGDCGVQSNCVAIQPLETPFGRKRKIDQSSCNKDFSCVKGFCPSFVTVHGAKIKGIDKKEIAMPGVAHLQTPDPIAINQTFAMLITGVGGTGVVTIGAIVGMAAHLEGKGVGIIDMAGLAQKGGAVTSHLRIGETPDAISSIRIPAGGADLVLACDIVVAGSAKLLNAMDRERTLVVANTHEQYPGDFIHNTDFSLPTRRIEKAILDRVDGEKTAFVEAQKLATNLLGDAIASNMFMLGFAYQRGGLPISAESIEEAIKLNGVAIEMNLAAFRWGRLASVDLEQVRLVAQGDEGADDQNADTTLDQRIAERAAFLTQYQDASYADRYRSRIAALQKAEKKLGDGSETLSDAVTRSLFKLMAIKDEFEVARLYTDGSFQTQLEKQFESWGQLEFHLAPPLLSKKDPVTGIARKSSYGPWMMRGFKFLASMKRFRGAWFDVFSKTAERKLERQVLQDYEAIVDEIAASLTAENHQAAVDLARYPEAIRGFGHVRAQSIEKSRLVEPVLLDAYRKGLAAPQAAE